MGQSHLCLSLRLCRAKELPPEIKTNDMVKWKRAATKEGTEADCNRQFGFCL